ncbi:hypothetical protein BKA65DRAFT_304151 [Rhexocercosporidium sp. MPI-PUGE-AT-0058]|nr:hypothetical protein BKA65DRAFT_304151 [Rhexocercosporidium sp. MPI-PUGE-AT-0058]
MRGRGRISVVLSSLDFQVFLFFLHFLGDGQEEHGNISGSRLHLVREGQSKRRPRLVVLDLASDRVVPLKCFCVCFCLGTSRTREGGEAGREGRLPEREAGPAAVISDNQASSSQQPGTSWFQSPLVKCLRTVDAGRFTRSRYFRHEGGGGGLRAPRDGFTVQLSVPFPSFSPDIRPLGIRSIITAHAQSSAKTGVLDPALIPVSRLSILVSTQNKSAERLFPWFGTLAPKLTRLP